MRSMASLRVPVRISALSLAVSGIDAAVSVPLHPNILNQPIGEVIRNTPAWVGLHLFAALVCVLSVIGVAGVVAAHEGRLGRTGQTGLLLTLLGSAAAGAVASVEALAFPAVADTAPQLLDLNGPLFNWPFIGMGIIALCWLVGMGLRVSLPRGRQCFPVAPVFF